MKKRLPTSQLGVVTMDKPLSISDSLRFVTSEAPVAKPVDKTPVSCGMKNDGGKPPYHLIPFVALEELVKVLDKGAVKYEAHNWRKVDNWRDRYLSAAFRHMVAYALGQKIDPETGCHHLAHTCASLFFMVEKELEKEVKSE